MDPSSLAGRWQQQAPWGSPGQGMGPPREAAGEQQEAEQWRRSAACPGGRAEMRLGTGTPTAWHGQGWRPQPEVKWGIRTHGPLKASWIPPQPPQPLERAGSEAWSQAKVPEARHGEGTKPPLKKQVCGTGKLTKEPGVLGSQAHGPWAGPAQPEGQAPSSTISSDP